MPSQIKSLEMHRIGSSLEEMEDKLFSYFFKNDERANSELSENAKII